MSLRFCGAVVLSLLLLAGVAPAPAQQPPEEDDGPEHAIQQEIGTKISPGVEELARELNISPQLERLRQLRRAGPLPSGTAESTELLGLQLELVGIVLETVLEVHGVTAQIGYEIAQMNDLREYLEDRRDRAIKYNSLANIISGSVVAALGNALDLSPGIGAENAGDIVEMAGGSVQSGLSLLALRQASGEKRMLGSIPNMLAKLFERPVSETTDYPPAVWEYLNSVPPGSESKDSRRARLIKKWTRLGLLQAPGSVAYRRRVEELTSTVPKQHKVTIDLLENRVMMMQDVEAVVHQMERGLLELLRYVRRL